MTKAEINQELDKLQIKYEKIMNKSAYVPPAIKAGLLKGITDKMDKLDTLLEGAKT